MLAILPSLGFQEMFVLLVIGLLLYGRNLPEAGRTLGRVTAQLRRGFNEFKDQMNRDADLSEMKQTLTSTKDEIRRTTRARRAIQNPKTALTAELRDLTNEALSSPLPGDDSLPRQNGSTDADDSGTADRNGADPKGTHQKGAGDRDHGPADGTPPAGSQPRR